MNADRSFNYLGLIWGLPGCGKTQLAKKLAADWYRQGDWIVIHDPYGQFRSVARAYPSADAWRDAWNQGTLPRSVSIEGGTADDVRSAVVDFCKRSPNARRVRFIADETSLLLGSSPSYVSPDDVILITGRRHLGVGPVLLLQDPNMLHPTWWRTATDIYVFRQIDAKRTQIVEERASLPGLTRAAAKLKQYEFLHVKPGISDFTQKS